MGVRGAKIATQKWSLPLKVMLSGKSGRLSAKSSDVAGLLALQPIAQDAVASRFIHEHESFVGAERHAVRKLQVLHEDIGLPGS